MQRQSAGAAEHREAVERAAANVAPAVEVVSMRRGSPYVVGKFYAIYADTSDALLAMVTRGPFDTANEAADAREPDMCVARECAR